MKKYLLCSIAALALTAPAVAAPVAFGGHYYEHITTGMTFDQARATALGSSIVVGGDTLGGYLVNVTSQAENDFIYSLTGGTNIWLGGSDEGNEGVWTWLDGPEAGEVFHSMYGAVTYSSFGFGEPNNSGGNEHVLESYGNGVWNDLPGASLRGFVIEYSTSSADVPLPATLPLMLGALAIGGALSRRKTQA